MSRYKPKKKRKIFKVLLIVVAVLIVAIVAYGYSIYYYINQTARSIHHPVERHPEVARATELSLNKKDPFSVLMLGVDERLGDGGRSDSIIVITVNPGKQSMKMLSLPRDTRVEIVGRGINDKINHAYAFGGVEMSLNTVEKYLDIPIDYYIKMNMEGFKEIVDAVGGITVNNDIDFTVGSKHFSKGEIFLNGKDALSYSRMRYDDARGDFGRQMRQRQVIEGVIRKGVNISSLWKYDDVLRALGKNVETNLTLDEIIHIQKNYRAALHQMDQFEMKGQGATIDSVWYYIVPKEEREKAQNRLKEHLNIK